MASFEFLVPGGGGGLVVSIVGSGQGTRGQFLLPYKFLK